MDSPAPSDPPRCNCRVCGQVMNAEFQRGTANVADCFIVTCANPACWMHEFTFSDVTYPLVCLANYEPATLPISVKSFEVNQNA